MVANSKSIIMKAVSSSSSSSSISIADLASCYCAIMLALILLTTASFSDHDHDLDQTTGDMITTGSLMLNRPCDEIYVVGEGETLNTISDKCGDPFIVEQNPHIHDPDDVFPGLVIKITPHHQVPTPTRSS
ncbi:uncharacterized protein LOC124928225 [Impatiens glandulifera]|uniref:uncharacterized protein LOC124928225 n=1 Tax=Impatiens glandulifera TaxID=253017 RepID=UPI001FB0B621|nr:uncharacterized protein LOC124928225 [Impatiens glandulifera]